MSIPDLNLLKSACILLNNSIIPKMVSVFGVDCFASSTSFLRILSLNLFSSLSVSLKLLRKAVLAIVTSFSLDNKDGTSIMETIPKCKRTRIPLVLTKGRVSAKVSSKGGGSVYCKCYPMWQNGIPLGRTDLCYGHH